MHYKSVKYYSMKKLLYLFLAMFITIGLNACSPDDNPIDDSDTETPENPNPDEPDDPDTPEPTRGKTLIVYYSFTNNVHTVTMRRTTTPSVVHRFRRFGTIPAVLLLIRQLIP